MTGDKSSSSTSRELARAMFQERIVPLARALRDRPLLQATPIAPGTHFLAPLRPAMSRNEMEQIAPSDALAELKGIWEAEGLDELVGLIDGLAEIRDLLAAAPVQEDGSPSHLIYALY